jgi:ubiquinone/menaquinone biosynthesis C-methylase UbiE
MSDLQNKDVADHYTKQDLGEAILAALKKAGKDPDNLKQEDLAPVDEFHIRGREATVELSKQLALDVSKHVLDVGSGVGGASRYLASVYGCHITGLDLTEEYCRVAQMLADRIGLGELVTYRQGNALDMPFDDASFDAVWTQHTAMNIADKAKLYAEMLRVLKPGGLLAIYDVVAGVGGPLIFPVPWAREPSISFLVTPDKLQELLKQTGFQVVSWRDTTEEGRNWFREVAEKMQKLSGAPPLGFHILLGSDFKTMASNQLRNLNENRIGLIETIVQRPLS